MNTLTPHEHINAIFMLLKESTTFLTRNLETLNKNSSLVTRVICGRNIPVHAKSYQKQNHP